MVSFFEGKEAGSFVPFAWDTLKKQAESLWHMAEDLDDSFDEVIRCLLSISGRIAVTGMGKSGHVARKVAASCFHWFARLFHHPAEASLGDLGMVSRHDAVIAFSNSGETAELSDIILFASRHGVPITGVTKRGFWPVTPIMSFYSPMSRKRALSDALPLRRRRFKWRSEMPLPFPCSRQGDSARRISIGSIRGEGLAGSS